MGTMARLLPGWRLGDASFSDAKEAAYRDYLDDLTSAYKNPAGDVGSRNFTDEREGDGHAGHLRHGADGDASVNDARDTAYAEYLDYITNAWRTKPPRVRATRTLVQVSVVARQSETYNADVG
jgi:hypothetical protein